MSQRQHKFMPVAEFDALCARLEGPEGCNFQQLLILLYAASSSFFTVM